MTAVAVISKVQWFVERVGYFWLLMWLGLLDAVGAYSESGSMGWVARVSETGAPEPVWRVSHQVTNSPTGMAQFLDRFNSLHRFAASKP